MVVDIPCIYSCGCRYKRSTSQNEGLPTHPQYVRFQILQKAAREKQFEKLSECRTKKKLIQKALKKYHPRIKKGLYYKYLLEKKDKKPSGKEPPKKMDLVECMKRLNIEQKRLRGTKSLSDLIEDYTTQYDCNGQPIYHANRPAEYVIHEHEYRKRVPKHMKPLDKE
ncbi:hypothetical protein SNEBB_001056 [Seison nebaliae]|nr:hypothetical protein SNEBB_001056 [Seison nebaliae]